MNAIKKIKDKAGSNSKAVQIKNKGYEIVSLDNIKKGQPFVDLFPIKQETLKSISEDMKVNGYDVSQPVIVWKETNVLLDGHTRCAAAEKAGLTEVAVIVESFPDVDTALKYTYGLQFNRRNLTDADKFQFSESYLNNVGQGAKKAGWKKKELAEILSVSVGTAQKYITVISRASDRTKESVKSGNLTINGAYKSLLDKEKRLSDKLDYKGLNTTKSKGRAKTKTRKKKQKTPENDPNLIVLEVSDMKKLLDKWGGQVDVELNNFYPFFPFRERLLGISEILPNGSDMKAYVGKLLEGGESK